MWSHSLSVSITKTKWLLQFTPLPWAFYFSLSSFPSSSTWSSPCHHHHHAMIFICFTTWECATYLMITWETRLTLRVSSIHQNHTRAFNLPLFGNWWQPLYKDMNWNLIVSIPLRHGLGPRWTTHTSHRRSMTHGPSPQHVHAHFAI